MDDELILDDSPELEDVIPEPETAPEEIQDNAQFYKGDPFRYSDFTPEQLEALKVKGDTGRGIASIDLTNTTGKVKTYTITFTDDTTTTFTVVDGNDGASPEITFVGTTIYVNGVAGPDLKGATGKSQYQSYLDTTTDNPPLSEAEWSAVKKNEEWFRIAHQLSISTSVNYYQNGHYNINGLTDSGKSDDNFLSSAGYTYHAFKNRKIKHLYLSIAYVASNLTMDARISCLKSLQYIGAVSPHTDVEQLFAEDIVLQSRKVFDFTAQVAGKTLETGKRLYIGLKKTGGTAQLAGIEYIICFEDF